MSPVICHRACDHSRFMDNCLFGSGRHLNNAQKRNGFVFDMRPHLFAPFVLNFFFFILQNQWAFVVWKLCSWWVYQQQVTRQWANMAKGPLKATITEYTMAITGTNELVLITMFYVQQSFCKCYYFKQFIIKPGKYSENKYKKFIVLCKKYHVLF